MQNQLNTKSKITSNYKSNLKNRLQNREINVANSPTFIKNSMFNVLHIINITPTELSLELSTIFQ